MSKHILIVDDDEDDRLLFNAALEKVDPSVKCSHATNGHEPLRMLRSSDNDLPDYIFLDLNMPRLNGEQCLQELKKDQLLSNIPVIIYTTSKLPEDKSETKNLGAVHFITKPSSFKELCKEILLVLSHRWEEVTR